MVFNKKAMINMLLKEIEELKKERGNDIVKSSIYTALKKENEKLIKKNEALEFENKELTKTLNSSDGNSFIYFLGTIFRLKDVIQVRFIDEVNNDLGYQPARIEFTLNVSGVPTVVDQVLDKEIYEIMRNDLVRDLPVFKTYMYDEFGDDGSFVVSHKEGKINELGDLVTHKVFKKKK